MTIVMAALNCSIVASFFLRWLASFFYYSDLTSILYFPFDSLPGNEKEEDKKMKERDDGDDCSDVRTGLCWLRHGVSVSRDLYHLSPYPSLRFDTLFICFLVFITRDSAAVYVASYIMLFHPSTLYKYIFVVDIGKIFLLLWSFPRRLSLAPLA